MNPEQKEAFDKLLSKEDSSEWRKKMGQKISEEERERIIKATIKTALCDGKNICNMENKPIEEILPKEKRFGQLMLIDMNNNRDYWNDIYLRYHEALESAEERIQSLENEIKRKDQLSFKRAMIIVYLSGKCTLTEWTEWCNLNNVDPDTYTIN